MTATSVGAVLTRVDACVRMLRRRLGAGGARFVVAAAIAAGSVALTPAGAHAQENLCFDRAGGFQASDPALPLVGDAQVLPDGTLRLTPASAGRAGMALSRQPVDLDSGHGFDATFRFRIDERDGQSDPWSFQLGGDGFAFVLQGAAEPVLGGGGGGLGYDGLPNSLAVEFDVVRNEWDVDSNHIEVHSRGTAPNSVDRSASLGGRHGVSQLHSDAVRTVRIRYTPPGDGEPGRLEVLLNARYVAEIDVDLSELLDLEGGRGYVGFTAATGDAFENHDILGLKVCRGDAAEDTPIVDPQQDDYSIDEDTSLHVPAPGVLGNDRISGGTPVIDIVGGPFSGHVEIDDSGEFTYTPRKDFAGPGGFYYRVCVGDTCAIELAKIIVREISVPTTLTATAAIAELGPGATVTPFLELSARLTTEGEPLPGRTIFFHNGTTIFCTGETDADGVARCDDTMALAQTVPALGYTASFSGGPDIRSASATAPLVKVNAPATPGT